MGKGPSKLRALILSVHASTTVAVRGDARSLWNCGGRLCRRRALLWQLVLSGSHATIALVSVVIACCYDYCCCADIASILLTIHCA